MSDIGNLPSRYGLREHGLAKYQLAHWNLGTSQLVEKALQRTEGMLASGGAFVVKTGRFTGRSPKDKYIVREPGTAATVDWGDVNQPMSEEVFDQMYARLLHSLETEELFIRPNPLETDRHKPEFTVLFAPRFYADAGKDGTRSTTCIALNFKKRVALI